MNTLTENNQPSQASPANAKPLWAAVGILGAAVLAMGGTMIYQGRGAAPASQAVAVLSTSAATTSGVPEAPASRSYVGGNSPTDDMVEKPIAQPAKPAAAHVPAKKVVKPTYQPSPSTSPNVVGAAPAPAPTVAPVMAVAAPICGNCGAVESVTPFERTTKADGPGIGAVAGGVAGAVLGQQVGRGNGRTVATILGAIGGGFAGNAIEKNMKKETIYQVNVRMEDDSRRTVELAQAPAVGTRVTVGSTGISSVDGAVYRAVVPAARRSNQSAPTYDTP